MRALTRLTLVLFLALVGALAACGDDGGSGTEVGLEDREGQEAEDDGSEDDDETDDGSDDVGPYVEALAGTFSSDETLTIPEDQAVCVAERVVDIIRLERIQAAGLTPEEFAGDDLEFAALGISIDDGRDIIDSFDGCDFDFYDAFIESFSATSDDPVSAQACIEGVADPAAFREFMARGFSEEGFGESEEADAFFGAMVACATGESGTGG